ncbi:unnamed protein product [marine sediment metagenome]|uniref:Uncharacterized protein n=1 Tax=marine sediment metagenome TaxID=412755 RepID=X1B2C9_9ZZZZ
MQPDQLMVIIFAFRELWAIICAHAHKLIAVFAGFFWICETLKGHPQQPAMLADSVNIDRDMIITHINRYPRSQTLREIRKDSHKQLAAQAKRSMDFPNY